MSWDRTRRGLLENLLVILGVGLGAGIVIAALVRFEPTVWSADHLYIDALVIVLIGYLFSRAFGSAIAEVLDREGRVRNLPIVRIFVDIVVYTIVVVALLSLFGVTAENLFFGSAFAAIILGLAAQTVFSNVLAGVVIAVTAPFRVGTRVSVISPSYGVVSSSYAHERSFPAYTGTILDLGLVYTDLRLDNGQRAKIPNGVLLGAMVVQQPVQVPRLQRVRMTFPTATPVADFERAVAAYRQGHRPPPGCPEAVAEIADLGPTSWDGVVAIWTLEEREEVVRDGIFRAILADQKAPPPPWSEGELAPASPGGPAGPAPP